MRFSLTALLIVSVWSCCNARATRRAKKAPNAETPTQTTVGLTLNGGGYTAGNGVAAVLRAFQKNKLNIDGEERPAIEIFDYMSGLSGGNPASIMYHYAQYTTSDELLEVYSIPSDPTKMTIEDLQNIPDRSIFKPFVTTTSISTIIGAIDAYLNGGEPWTEVVYYHFFLQNYIAKDLLMTDAKIRDEVKSIPIVEFSLIGPSELYPDWSDTLINRAIVEDYNDQFQTTLTAIDDEGFVQLAAITTEIIADYINKVFGDVVMPPFNSTTDTPPTSYQMDNSFILKLAETHKFKMILPAYGTSEKFVIPMAKGMVMEFDGLVNRTYNPIDVDEPTVALYSEVSPDTQPFTLEKLLGMGTDNLGLFPYGADMYRPILDSISPGLGQRPISVDVPFAKNGKTTTHKMAFTDGGCNDINGLPALLHQKPKKIVMALNRPTGPTEYTTEEVHRISAINEMVEYFGVVTDPIDPNTNAATRPITGHVFNIHSGGENQLVKLNDIYSTLMEAGEPLIATLEGLEVVENPFWGLEGGWTVDVTIISFNGVPKKFGDLIPEGIATPPLGRDIIENGLFTNETFFSVPNVIPIPITEEVDVIDIPLLGEIPIPSLGQVLPLEAARMTQIMIGWAIDHAWDGIFVDGKEIFGGFPKFFEDVGESDDNFGVMSVSDDETDEEPKSVKTKKGKKGNKKPKAKKGKKEKVKKPKI